MNLLNSSTSLFSEEYVSIFTWVQSDIIILVYSFSGFGNYNLTLESSFLVQDDSYEDNDTSETASLITADEYSGIIWLDIDYYNISILKNERITIEFVSSNHLEISCVIFDSNMKVLNSSEGYPNSNYLNVLSTKNQFFIIRFASNNGLGAYNFTISIEEINSEISPFPTPSNDSGSTSSSKNAKEENFWSIVLISSIAIGLSAAGTVVFILMFKNFRKKRT
ncbi:MAG: hypothetical protein GF383_15685 [Candidatus Lokiarchaeota archaeon]|nr:hypothetical protein [Candidatus Lokiarchaeota archaeon]